MEGSADVAVYFCLCLLSSSHHHHHGSDNHVYPYTHSCTATFLEGMGGGQLIGGWGTRVWTSEKLAFHRKSSRLDRALTPRDAYQSKYIHSATDITSLHYGSSFLWFLLVLLCVLLFSPVIFGLTTASAPRLLRACVSLDSLANWELVPTGCTLS